MLLAVLAALKHNSKDVMMVMMFIIIRSNRWRGGADMAGEG